MLRFVFCVNKATMLRNLSNIGAPLPLHYITTGSRLHITMLWHQTLRHHTLRTLRKVVLLCSDKLARISKYWIHGTKIHVTLWNLLLLLSHLLAESLIHSLLL